MTSVAAKSPFITFLQVNRCSNKPFRVYCVYVADIAQTVQYALCCIRCLQQTKLQRFSQLVILHSLSIPLLCQTKCFLHTYGSLWTSNLVTTEPVLFKVFSPNLDIADVTQTETEILILSLYQNLFVFLFSFFSGVIPNVMIFQDFEDYLSLLSSALQKVLVHSFALPAPAC